MEALQNIGSTSKRAYVEAGLICADRSGADCFRIILWLNETTQLEHKNWLAKTMIKFISPVVQ